jgi:hypothetical protein
MHMVTSNHVYADELTVHGEHDVKTGMQQAWKRERPGAPPPVGKSLQAQQDKQVTRTLRSVNARSYLKSDTNAASTTVCQQQV